MRSVSARCTSSAGSISGGTAMKYRPLTLVSTGCTRHGRRPFCVCASCPVKNEGYATKAPRCVLALTRTHTHQRTHARAARFGKDGHNTLHRTRVTLVQPHGTKTARTPPTLYNLLLQHFLLPQTHHPLNRPHCYSYPSYHAHATHSIGPTPTAHPLTTRTPAPIQ